MRSAYEQLTPRLVQALEGCEIVQLEFGMNHSAARTSIRGVLCSL
jgi:hypothetical protein